MRVMGGLLTVCYVENIVVSRYPRYVGYGNILYTCNDDIIIKFGNQAYI
jgi:hypothetical protein